MKIGYIGLGKMGANMVELLHEKRHQVVAYDRDLVTLQKLGMRNIVVGATDIPNMVMKLEAPRTVWLMVPHEVVTDVISELSGVLQSGDTVIDGGNTHYTESMKHAEMLKAKGIDFLDAGVSGGPNGARRGSCIMVGGNAQVYDKYEQLFRDLSVPEGCRYVGDSGAGHFVKMIHNGIEYGMMQSIAEGFGLMHDSEFNLNLEAVADLYNHGSVIESRLVEWLEKAYQQHGQALGGISGTVNASGEGAWTVQYAQEKGGFAPAIETALNFRRGSIDKPSYIGQILSALRNQFGGHNVSK